MKHSALLQFVSAWAVLSCVTVAPIVTPDSAVVAQGAAMSPSPLPFVHGDYARALEMARSQNVPLVVNLWVPWWHEARAMNAFVFADPKLAAYAPKFVWLELDAEAASSAPLLERFATDYWPTLLVLDSKSEKPLLRWSGMASPEKLMQLLDDAASGKAEGVEGELAAADALFASGRAFDAATAYRALLAHAAADWARRGRAVESLLLALRESSQEEACGLAALSLVPSLARDSSLTNALALGLDCTLSAPDNVAWRKETLDALVEGARVALAPPRIELLPTERSNLYAQLVRTAQAQIDIEATERLAGDWAMFLEEAALEAKTPDQRAVFNEHRVWAYTAMNAPDRAIDMLQESERALPTDYSPPAMLANVAGVLAARAGNIDMSQWEQAFAASDRALARVYGPRKLRLLWDRADLDSGAAKYQSMYERWAELRASHPPAKSRIAARRTMEQALAFAEALPAGHRIKRDRIFTVTPPKIRKRLADAIQAEVDGMEQEVKWTFEGIDTLDRPAERARGEVWEPEYQFTRSHREFSHCAGFGEKSRTLYLDGQQRTRKYVVLSSTGDPTDPYVLLQQYYRDDGTLMYVVATGEVEKNGAAMEHRRYFDASGAQIWETRQAQSPGWAVSLSWPAPQLVFKDAQAAFDGKAPCPERQPRAAIEH